MSEQSSSTKHDVQAHDPAGKPPGAATRQALIGRVASYCSLADPDTLERIVDAAESIIDQRGRPIGELVVKGAQEAGGSAEQAAPEIAEPETEPESEAEPAAEPETPDRPDTAGGVSVNVLWRASESAKEIATFRGHRPATGPHADERLFLGAELGHDTCHLDLTIQPQGPGDGMDQIQRIAVCGPTGTIERFAKHIERVALAFATNAGGASGAGWCEIALDENHERLSETAIMRDYEQVRSLHGGVDRGEIQFALFSDGGPDNSCSQTVLRHGFVGPRGSFERVNRALTEFVKGLGNSSAEPCVAIEKIVSILRTADVAFVDRLLMQLEKQLIDSPEQAETKATIARVAKLLKRVDPGYVRSLAARVEKRFCDESYEATKPTPAAQDEQHEAIAEHAERDDAAVLAAINRFLERYASTVSIERQTMMRDELATMFNVEIPESIEAHDDEPTVLTGVERNQR